MITASNLGSGNVALFSMDEDGNPLGFYVTRVESRHQIEVLIKERGGLVLERVVPADTELTIVCVVNEPLHKPLTLPEGMIVVKRQFIIDCIEQNQLLPFADYKPDQDNVLTAPTTPQGRNAYTEIEDRALLDAVREAIDMGYSEDGMKMYKVVAPHFPRHTPQSLRDRYLKHLALRQQCLLVSSSPLRARIEKHAMTDSGDQPTKWPKPTDTLIASNTDDCIVESKTAISIDRAMETKRAIDEATAVEDVSFEALTQAMDRPMSDVMVIDSEPDQVATPTSGQTEEKETSTEDIQEQDDSEAKKIRQTVEWISETTGQQIEVVLFVLYQCNGNVMESVQFLRDTSRQVNWECEEDIALVGRNDTAAINKIIAGHGPEAVKARQSFLSAVCQNS